ncbi:MAG: glycosyl hydrolase 53 family protein [Alphaproteobacteria bacterium]
MAFRIRLYGFLLTAAVVTAGCYPTPKHEFPAAPPPSPPVETYTTATRPFLMGFTLWPADLTREGLAIAQRFAYAHGDLVAVTFLGGVPWPEAFAGKEFSQDVRDNFAYRPPEGKRLLLSISPLDRNRKGLAPYWGEQENLPLPKPWDKEPLNGQRVKKAFTNFVSRAVAALRPDYLAIGMEANVLLSRDPVKWKQFKELYRDTYAALKKAHPGLPVFFTTDILHYKKLARDAKRADQEKEVAELMRSSDLFAMSVYPHMSVAAPHSLPASFFDFARRFNKPIAVSDSGMTSRTVALKTYGIELTGSPTAQAQFIRMLLAAAARDHYKFVVNFATTDSEKLVARLRPPLDDLARMWAFIGLQTSAQVAKPALAIWDSYWMMRYDPQK